jgi:hypothetical protein
MQRRIQLKLNDGVFLLLTRNRRRGGSDGEEVGVAVAMMKAECAPGARDDVEISILKSRPLNLEEDGDMTVKQDGDRGWFGFGFV